MTPRVSIAMPVRNGIKYLSRAVDSILAQDCEDLELVISDNASDDGTSELCQAYAEKDARVRHHRHSRDIGQVCNFNYVFRMARGEYFKWNGVDDWLAPNYASRCSGILEQNPDVVCAFSHEQHLDDDGTWFDYHYDSFNARSSRPHDRFRRLLTVYQRDPEFNIDPIYSMMRRRTVEQTGGFRGVIFPHIVMGAQLGLMGHFHQIPEVLAFRRKRWLTEVPRDELLQRYFAGTVRPTRSLFAVELGMVRALFEVIQTSDIPAWEKAACRLTAAKYFARQTGDEVVRRAPGYPARASRRLWDRLAPHIDKATVAS